MLEISLLLAHNYRAASLPGPGCPASCGFYTACTLTDKRIRSQLPLPRARLFNKDNVAFQQEYECPEVNGIQCKIPLLYKNDDFCDCPGCEDEDNHNCTTCGTDIPEEYSVLVTADTLVTCPDDCEAGFDRRVAQCVGGGQPLREGTDIFTCPGLNNSCEILAAARNDGRCDSWLGPSSNVFLSSKNSCSTTYSNFSITQQPFDATLLFLHVCNTSAF